MDHQLWDGDIIFNLLGSMSFNLPSPSRFSQRNEKAKRNFKEKNKYLNIACLVEGPTRTDFLIPRSLVCMMYYTYTHSHKKKQRHIHTH